MTDTALLVMDFQQGVVERLGDATVLDAARRAVDAAREADLLVIYVRVGFREGYPEVSPANRSFAAITAGSAALLGWAHPALVGPDAACLQPRFQKVIAPRISLDARPVVVRELGDLHL